MKILQIVREEHLLQEYRYDDRLFHSDGQGS